MEVRMHEPGEEETDRAVLGSRGRILAVPDSVTDKRALFTWLVDKHGATDSLAADAFSSFWSAMDLARVKPVPLRAGLILHARGKQEAPADSGTWDSLYRDEVAFELPYRNLGNVDTLYDLLALIVRTKKEDLYAPAVSLFQSSGWGKTRTVIELWQKNVCVVYCSFANPQGSGYPRRSWIADWFLQQCGKYLNGDNALIGQLACMTFCVVFFGECIRIAKTRLHEGEGYQEFVTSMRKGGQHFWEQVKTQTESILQKGIQAALVKTHETLDLTWERWDDRSEDWLYRNCLLDRSSDLQYLLVFDEARHLVHSGLMDTNLFVPITRSTRAFRSFGICALFMDTSAQISIFAPPLTADASDRLSKGLSKIAPPIWASFSADLPEESFPFPFFAGNKFADIVRDIRAVRYGRPLWWAVFEAEHERKKPPTAAFNESYKLARDKLLGGRGKWVEFIVSAKKLTAEAALSLLGPTVAIDVDPRSNYASKLVANNLLTVVSVSESGELVWTAWSPEPLVAMAASEGVRTLHKAKRYNDLYDPVVQGLQTGWIDKGYEGELVSRIILLHAMGKATDSDGTVHDEKLAGCCTVDEFCKHLVGRSFLDLLRLNQGPTENEKKLAGARLCFNSFQRIFKKSSELDFGDVKMCIERRCAAICRSNTWGDDMWLFAFLGSDDEELTEENVTAVHVQVKHQSRSHTKITLAKMSPEYSGLKIGSNRPYLSLYMNVTVTGKEAKGVSLVNSNDIEEYVKCHARAHKPIWEALEDDGGTVAGTAVPMVVEGAKEGETNMVVEDSIVPMAAKKGKRKRKPAVEAWKKWFQAKRELQHALAVKDLNDFQLDDGLKDILRKIVSASKSPFHTYPNGELHEAWLDMQKSKLKDMSKFTNVHEQTQVRTC